MYNFPYSLQKQVQKSADHYTEAARDEIELLAAIAGSADQTPAGAAACVWLLDSFEHRGPHGRHICMVFEVDPTSRQLPATERNDVLCPGSSTAACTAATSARALTSSQVQTGLLRLGTFNSSHQLFRRSACG